MKWCSGCEAERPVADFGADRSRRDGLNKYCRTCVSKRHAAWRARRPEGQAADYAAKWRASKADSNNAYMRRYRAAHPERVKESRARFYATHHERLKALVRIKRAADPEQFRQRQKAWRLKNPKQDMLNRARHRARVRGLEFTLTPEDIDLPKTCPVLGIPIVYGREEAGPNSPSLDRRDNTKGYIKGNVTVISFRANQLKSDATPDELRALAAFFG